MFTDIHCHIIPAIDDGASDEKMAIEMLRIAGNCGTENIIATPHYIYGSSHDSSTITEKCILLNNLARQEGMDLTIHPGCEVFICPELPDLYEKKVINTLANSKYMLVELPMTTIPAYADEVLYNLQLKGVVPVIAHPERYAAFQEEARLLKNMVRRGILTQINSGSITGLYGRHSQKAALKFIKEGLAHFVASDSHNNRRRSPDLNKASKMVANIFGKETMEILFYKNGMRVIRNDDIEEYVSSRRSYNGSFIQFIMSKVKAVLKAQ